MANGISVHIGVNDVDADHYGGWSSPLKACENDANDMHALAKGVGFSSRLLVAAEATRGAVTDAIKTAASELVAGDIFFLTFAGHGGQLKDMDGDEADGKDETWVLYDGQLLDDELNVLWAEFDPGVRVLVLSDSCHSGSVSKGEGEDDDDGNDSRPLFWRTKRLCQSRRRLGEVGVVAVPFCSRARRANGVPWGVPSASG